MWGGCPLKYSWSSSIILGLLTKLWLWSVKHVLKKDVWLLDSASCPGRPTATAWRANIHVHSHVTVLLDLSAYDWKEDPPREPGRPPDAELRVLSWGKSLISKAAPSLPPTSLPSPRLPSWPFAECPWPWMPEPGEVEKLLPSKETPCGEAARSDSQIRNYTRERLPKNSPKHYFLGWTQLTKSKQNSLLELDASS